MPLLSVLTAVRNAIPEFFAEAAASVAAQELPAGWELEWLVQEDGDDPAASELCPGARYEANGAQLGTATTRNLALSRARGELVAVLDYDDVLLPGGLGTVVNAFAEHPGIGWAVGQADDLVDGVTVPYELKYPCGLVTAGTIGKLYEETGLCQVACAGLVMPTEIVRAFGGWAAIPRAEDVGLFIAISEVYDGYQEPAVTWAYRKHPAQTTHAGKEDRWGPHQDRFIRQRLDVVRAGVVNRCVRPGQV
ncbi:Glycosyl transferase family 2 [Allokutzneria albata]|uniref:Glycosyl transferase family 2 n=1 Tax=Allokutzneria albata TaxID=211114 RepID=A0A1G9U6A6_ALLAB|nr:Glycosyl transferase family 2 [Allokutzneria albata]